mmetsp:Transcript_12720/g.36334  ORF Transcript_12720/g.36334 Transcript_12720/m.36334 type:complete len:141 (+) Transcript_12720:100-522(+)
MEIHTGQHGYDRAIAYRRSVTFDRNNARILGDDHEHDDEVRGSNEENGHTSSRFDRPASAITTANRTDHLSIRTVNSGLLREEEKKSRKATVFRVCCMKCSRHFFDHFLDGSAGVMYTSFVGLIIDEFIRWGIRGEKQEI